MWPLFRNNDGGIKTTSVKWRPGWRIIPSLFPPKDLFVRVAADEDLEAIYALESLTNDRLRNEKGEIQIIPPEEAVTGPGASFIMASFTHLTRVGTRFTDGSFGVFYASYNLDTAIEETKHHRENFMRATNEPPMTLYMRVLNIDIEADLHDLRKSNLPGLYDYENYSASQALAKQLRGENSTGIIYDSVRLNKGTNVAIFKPKALSNCRQERHLCYEWNGEKIARVAKV